jgi:2-polyprenyl-6-methoxyphenol hydroxylase-like FAD-dependent oxidoreductase
MKVAPLQVAPLQVAPLQVIVVGAGVGGLAAAVALRRSGFQVEVYERRSGPAAELGTGSTLWTNLSAANGAAIGGSY